MFLPENNVCGGSDCDQQKSWNKAMKQNDPDVVEKYVERNSSILVERIQRKNRNRRQRGQKYGLHDGRARS